MNEPDMENIEEIKQDESCRTTLGTTDPDEIILLLDTYNDIFSDFDPRPYSQTSISEDFLAELRRASYGKNEKNIQMTLVMDGKRRSLKDEAVIKKRLAEHFNRHRSRLKKNVKKPILNRGFKFVITGIVLMFIATLLLSTQDNSSLLKSFLIILVEPAGWFFLWHGMELILFEAKKINPELSFYGKMARCKITFRSI